MFGGRRSRKCFQSVVATVAGTRNKNQNQRSRDLVDGDHGVTRDVCRRFQDVKQ